MKKLILIASLAGAVAAVPAGAQQTWHRHHHHHAVMASNPGSVTIDGKDYKVCGGAIQDDCINPRQAGLHYGDRPTNHYSPAKAEAETPPSQ